MARSGGKDHPVQEAAVLAGDAAAVLFIGPAQGVPAGRQAEGLPAPLRGPGDAGLGDAVDTELQVIVNLLAGGLPVKGKLAGADHRGLQPGGLIVADGAASGSAAAVVRSGVLPPPETVAAAAEGQDAIVQGLGKGNAAGSEDHLLQVAAVRSGTEACVFDITPLNKM